MTFREQAENLVAQMTVSEKISQMVTNAPAIPRLNIPAFNWWNECLHGVARSGEATVFPQAIAMAASFNEKLLEKVADVIAVEARAKYNQFKKFGDTDIYQGLNFFTPNINIFRDPRWGRGHETYGEDPVLTGCMGAAFVRGLQGNGKYRKANATIKHYAVHSGPESVRHSFDVHPTEKDLFETYLWAFEYCIKNADPASVMGAYNRVNGEPCCGSKRLLQEILRDRFGFKGFVVSDCGAIMDFHTGHKVTSSTAESAALAVKNGCDLNCGSAYAMLSAAVAEGMLEEKYITEAVTRLFETRYRLGLFADDCVYDDIPYDVVECPAHLGLSKQMAREGVVLLKNNGILPLSDKQKVAVIGPNAASIKVLNGNYAGTAGRYVTVLEGIQAVCAGKVYHAQGCDIVKSFSEGDGWAENLTREALVAAQNADTVIMVMGLDPSLEGEEGDASYSDCNGDKSTIALPQVQSVLYEEIRKTGKPIVFVNVSGSAVGLKHQDETADAVVQLFYPGAQGGTALAEILFGKVSPSGRLPITFYESTNDLPPFEDYSMENRTYRFYKGKPVYPFGHGLSYSNITETRLDNENYTVTNDGPFDVDYSLLRFDECPDRRLVGFEKIHLKSGETKTVAVKNCLT